ncbi:MAG: UDP-3-O-[3-hydroxymyristoyl] N-acetylglucosamine deacetylase [Alphaproteobacteria bacterium]|nr:UDP-3-O-[3-hydroxymyristoyl] N-acetylglucosamine deacetylase [Alphaproteobacteria bacterium]
MNRATIAREITATGIALHAGVPVTMVLSPAPAGAGVIFERRDKDATVPARWDLVGETRLGTVITLNGAGIGVIEHLMAAVAGAEIDDLFVTLDGPEPPILHGDAWSYLALLQQAGRREQGIPRRALKILKDVTVGDGKGSATLRPAETLSYHFEITFPSAAIGTQRFDFAFSREAFAREIAPARTFGFLKELDYLKSIDRGHGASLDNTLAIDGDQVLNKHIMRFPDEFVRHKILDAIGDMALAGAPLLARFEGVRSGHGLNNALLRAVFADPTHYTWVEL